VDYGERGRCVCDVGVAPARKELRSGPNKSEREPTSARSTNYGSGHLIPAFHGTGRTFSLLPSHPLDAASCSIDAPLVSCLRGKVPRPKMVSSNQKKFQLCFVRNSPRGTSEPRVFNQNENPARVRVRGLLAGTLIWWCTKREIPPAPPKGLPGPVERCVFPGACASFKRMQLGGIPVSTFLTERRAVGFLRHLANILARSHCWAILVFECHN